MNPKDTKELSFYADPEKSKLHPGCECCIHSEKRLQRALEAEAREYELLQKLKTIKEQNELLETTKHYPGCNKVHLECANKKIEELVAICSRRECEHWQDDWMCKYHPFIKWLESLGKK